MRTLGRVTLAAATILAFTPHTSSAATTLTLEDPGSAIYQQTENSPCVIGDPSCNNPTGFGFTQIPSGSAGDNYDLYSPQYSVSTITRIVGSTFIVGVDVNSTTKPLATEFLDAFNVYTGGTLVNGVLVGGTLLYTYDPASPGHNLNTVNNGNGFSDSLLRTVDLTGLSSGTLITFEAIVKNATDGREEFFLISTNAPPSTVPEPASLTLLGTGLLGLGARVARRKRA